MPQIHIANTCFEHELAGLLRDDLTANLHSLPFFLQLQYLPFLYGDRNDAVLVTHTPPQNFLENLEKLGIDGPKTWHLYSAKKPISLAIESWGMSAAIQKWADESNLAIFMPPASLVKEVNSKAFSFAQVEPLPKSRLLYRQEELHTWIESFEGRKVLKTCYGLSGGGHFHIASQEDDAKAASFASIEWQKGLPVIAEPWVKRDLDFSTQWHLASQGNIEYLGATICENDAFGRYQATKVGKEDELFSRFLPFLYQHKQAVMPMLDKIAALGFFGNIGIDAMVYNENMLHPIVEINARKTMGFVALEITRRHFPGRNVRIAIEKNSSSPSLLPISLSPRIRFPKNLILQVS